MGYNKGEFFISGDSRKKKIYSLLAIIIVLVIISLYSFILHVKSNSELVITYDEVGDLDYKVYLKENEFFRDKYLDKDKQYIASLIDYIDATFNYDLTITNKESDYDYSYRIEAEVNVINPENNNSLYKSSELLVSTKTGKGRGHRTTNISERLKIDYNKYNDLISKFIETYDLTHLESNLSINMYVDFDGECGSNQKENQKSVVKLVIPLTTKTVAIDMNYDTASGTDNYIKCGKSTSFAYIVFAFLTSGLAIGLAVELKRYVDETKSPIEVYNSKLKKIVNNYGSFIQKINGDYDMSKSQILKVDSFDDMLEIRDTLQAPILMLENKDKYGVFFIIPTAYKILYTYALRVEDIKMDMINEALDEPKKEIIPKEYNDEYITKQITMIGSDPADGENTIKGTKDSDEDLYSQIEKTQEFRLNLKDEDISELFKELEDTDVADVKKKKKKTKKSGKTSVKTEEPKKVESKKEGTKKVASGKVEVKKIEPEKVEVKKVVPEKVEIKKVVPKKEEVKKVETKKEEPKKEETKVIEKKEPSKKVVSKTVAKKAVKKTTEKKVESVKKETTDEKPVKVRKPRISAKEKAKRAAQRKAK